jgi:hypothetical protein
MVNTDKLHDEIRAAGLPISTISLHRFGSFTPTGTSYYMVENEYWIEWATPLTGPQTTTFNAILAAHDPVDYPAIREATAESQAANVPQWAGYTEAEALQWLADNIGTPLDASLPATVNATTNRAIIVSLIGIMKKQYAAQVATTRMVVALRNRTFPKLEGS